MSHDGVLSVYDSGIVAPLVEHTHIHAQDIGEVDCAVHSPFIRADNHQVVLVRNQIRHITEQRLHELIGRIEGIKSL